MKTSRFFLSKNGFTLIEILVVISIFSILSFGVTLLITNIFSTGSGQNRLLDNNDQARKLAGNFTNEIRNIVTSATGAYPIEIAGSQQIVFYTKQGTSINRIRYFFQNGSLYKGVVIPSGSPLTYNLASETVALVQKALATGVGDALFEYYDSNFNGTGNPLVQPVNVTTIKYVTLNLKIYLQGSKNLNANTYNVSASATIRNLKDNL